jgi:hypothetical protein
MKGLSAGLTFFNIATVCGLLLGIFGHGLGPATAALSLLAGMVAGIAAYMQTCDPGERADSAETAAPGTNDRAPGVPPKRARYSRVFLWLMVALFALFALRSFCWLLYIDGDEFMIQSPNNLGDLALHITYIKDFANGTPLWPANPIYPIGLLRYPAGADLFNGLLSLVHMDLIMGLVWVGLAASVATCYALFRWGGTFAIAGFLCNGGVAGFAFLNTGKFLDYQGDKTIAWKSLPLSMFVTQRGLLYAIPAGLLLLWQWRERYFRNGRRPPLPFWVEVSLYASMPLFHVHTFLALSIVLAFLFVCGNPPMRGQLLTLVVVALVPAAALLWVITDHFQARAIMEWKPGWVLNDPEFKRSNFLLFWWDNFGILGPLVLALFGFCGWRAWKNTLSKGGSVPEEIAFLIPAAALIIIALLVKLAPWEWDNLKVMIWAYFIILPFLWTHLIRSWSVPLRVAACLALFGSGFVTLFGGMAVGRPGFGFAGRTEQAAVDLATAPLPTDARFAAYPTYNHPVLLAGRNVVLGYGGHLWTQGFGNYSSINERLTNLMLGRGDWQRQARVLGARYIFWGREEKQNYEDNPAGPKSTKPWERVLQPVAAGSWGAIYDVEQAPPGNGE